MAALSAYAAGLPAKSIEILSQALSSVFGEISITELAKDNLRFNVRTSVKSTSVVLVILDAESEESCRDIENGLYSSEKYHKYSDDAELVAFLNGKYGLSLSAPVEEASLPDSKPSEVGTLSSAPSVDYVAQLADKDALITTLQATIAEYQMGTPEPLEDSEELSSLRSDLQDATDKCKSLEAELSTVTAERNEARADGSRKAGVIRNKDIEISRLTSQVENLSGFVSMHQNCASTISELEGTVTNLQAKVTRLTQDGAEKDRELDKLRPLPKKLKDLETAKAAVDTKLSELQIKYDSVVKEKDELSADLAKSRGTVEELEGTVSKLSADTAKKDGYIAQLNSTNAQLRAKVELGGASSASGIDDMLAEISSLRRENTALKGGVFGLLGSNAVPTGKANIPVLKSMGARYDNIRFVFSGSTESRRGTYKCLLNEFSSGSSEKPYLLVDAVSETYADYVFEINKPKNGLQWFLNGGGFSKRLSSTVLENVKVLSPGLGYLNDTFLLAMDWASRLKELNESGYNVVLYCGDLSNIVGRVLFENFADAGVVEVYTQGNSVGSRTVYSASRGLTGIKSAVIKYFDYDTRVERFVSLMQETNVCQILSRKNGVSE
jgi:predicted nuclease with TOPRIM domain